MDDFSGGYSDISFRLIRQYAQYRYDRLARRVIHHLRRVRATGTFSSAHKCGWDEYCHDVQFGPHPDTFRIEMERVQAIQLGRAVDDVHQDEAAILSFWAVWDQGNTSEIPTGVVDRGAMRTCLERTLHRIAMNRDLSSFCRQSYGVSI